MTEGKFLAYINISKSQEVTNDSSNSSNVTVQGGDVKPPVALTLWKDSPGAAEKEKHCLS